MSKTCTKLEYYSKKKLLCDFANQSFASFFLANPKLSFFIFLVDPMFVL